MIMTYEAFRRRTGMMGIALALAGALGCNSGKTYPVQGKVVYKDGTPLTEGMVVFEPVAADAKVSARGQIEPDGTFRLGTYKEDDGAVEGRHRALVVPPPPLEDGERRPARPPIHPRFQSFDRSKLEFTVTRDKEKNHFTIVVERP